MSYAHFWILIIIHNAFYPMSHIRFQISIYVYELTKPIHSGVTTIHKSRTLTWIAWHGINKVWFSWTRTLETTKIVVDKGRPHCLSVPLWLIQDTIEAIWCNTQTNIEPTSGVRRTKDTSWLSLLWKLEYQAQISLRKLKLRYQMFNFN